MNAVHSAVCSYVRTILIMTIIPRRSCTCLVLSRPTVERVFEGGLLANELDCPPRTGCVSVRTSRASFALPSFSPAGTPRWTRALNRDSGSKEPPPSVPPPWQPTPCRRRRGLLALLPLRGWLTSGVTTNTYLHVFTERYYYTRTQLACARAQTGMKEREREREGGGEEKRNREREGERVTVCARASALAFTWTFTFVRSFSKSKSRFCCCFKIIIVINIFFKIIYIYIYYL